MASVIDLMLNYYYNSANHLEPLRLATCLGYALRSNVALSRYAIRYALRSVIVFALV